MSDAAFKERRAASLAAQLQALKVPRWRIVQPSREEYVVKPESTTPCCSIPVKVEATVEKRCLACRNVWRVEVAPAGAVRRLEWTLLN